MRCFIALDFDDEIKRFCDNKIVELKEKGFKAKWVESNNFHLTLFFMGDIEQNETAMLKWIIKSYEFEPFKLCFERLGSFKRRGKPYAIWLGIKENKFLTSLYEDLNEEIKQKTGRNFDRGFKPHLTIGRVKQSPENWSEIFKHQTFKEIQQTVNKVHLYSSKLTKNGPIYKQLI